MCLSPSYIKRISILETVAKVKSWIVMLDLDCDALLIEMFQNFLKTIRMMRCYINCLSRYVSVTNSLLLTLSACPQVLQVARRLAEQVLSNCARKLQTYLTAAVNSLGVSLDKYSKIVALKYDGTFRTLPQDQLVKNEKEPSVSSEKPAPKSKKEVKQPIEDSPNTSIKRKQSLGKQKASDIQSHTGNLVGSRVRVWWPIDKEGKPQTVGKSAGAKSRSSKEIPEAGTSKDQGDSGKSKASSKKKEEPSKTTMMSSKSKSGPAKPSSAKGKAAKGKQNLHLPPRARRAMWSLNQKRHRRHQNQLKKGNQLFSGKSQASQTKSAKKRKR
ncbi:unnamed protein product [Brassica rapa]|uniref:Uncharacterized protein n=1 Tax=Brassica campestris TaxID=3711 RepID=A0A8D9M4S3_BRACM|nr:unnamed protein product [Brassica rapa]